MVLNKNRLLMLVAAIALLILSACADNTAKSESAQSDKTEHGEENPTMGDEWIIP
ncbi:hypothetical protein LSPH24S_07423 [Lysinibacillus sphaericus]